jgi:phospholipid/cholesterol/gamma-HCH transport system substrate-binding protein
VVRGREPYAFPGDVKVLGEDRGPNCFGLPYVTPGEASLTYQPTFDTGVNPFKETDSGARSSTDILDILGIGGR